MSSGDQIIKRLNRKPSGFTIIELLVVIVVIGILTSIGVISYSGISQKARAKTLESDLISASLQLEQYHSFHGVYPDSLDTDNCPVPADTNYCLKISNGNSYTAYTSDGKIFGLTETSAGGIVYNVTDSTLPTAGVYVYPWLVIGTQTWAKSNLNVGAMITGVTDQTNNSVLEKYCYNNTESNCTTYGALYQWDEAMQYVKTAGAQGICPVSSHIPTDNDWKILEMQLGMTQGQADATDWRGTNQGTQLRPRGASGLNLPLAGYRVTGGTFISLSSNGGFWSSSESGSTAVWNRYLSPDFATVYRNPYVKTIGFSVRCVKN